jgi:hypothetical protein
MNLSHKKSAFYFLLSPFFIFSLSCSFFFLLLSGWWWFVVVAWSKSSPFLFVLLYAAHFYYNSAIRPTNQLLSLSLTYTPLQKKRMNTRKKSRVRVISSKNVVIVTCIQVTKIVMKNLAQTKKDERERWRARFLICVNRREKRRLRHRQTIFFFMIYIYLNKKTRFMIRPKNNNVFWFFWRMKWGLKKFYQNWYWDNNEQFHTLDFNSHLPSDRKSKQRN